MQKEFEKQVKEKMEELDFVPSTPVWSKIEVQIRQEKDRRRLLFWLPFFTLLLGGGITWFMINATGKSSLAQQDRVENTKVEDIPVKLPAEDPSSNSFEPGSIVQVIPENHTPQTKVNIDQNKVMISGSEPVKAEVRNTSISADRQRSDARTTGNKIASFKKNTETKQVPAILHMVGEADRRNMTPVSVNGVQEPQQKIEPARERIPINISDSQARKKEFVLTAPPLSEEVMNRLLAQVGNSQIQDETVLNTKTFGRTKWKFGFDVSGGISGAGDGLPLYSRRYELVSDAAYSAPPPPSYLQNRSLEPSSFENSISFGAGMVVQKQISKRLAFSTGLRYQYLSTSRKVGFKVLSFASGNSGMVSGGYTAAPYHNYVNRFHFIALPLALEYRPLKKIPLQVQGGFAFQHLLETNALHFNELSRVYQKDDEQFRKNQVFAEGGLNFSFAVRKLTFHAGPHVQYSLHSLGTSYQGQHLFTMGLKTKILFNN